MRLSLRQLAFSSLTTIISLGVIAPIYPVVARPEVENKPDYDYVVPSKVLDEDNDEQETNVIKFKLEDASVSLGSADWIRLEITGNKVRVFHITRTRNWLTQIQKWWNHPIRNITFKPDSCPEPPSQLNSRDLESKLEEYQSLYEQNLISEEEYNLLRNNAIRSEFNPRTESEIEVRGEKECLIENNNNMVKLKQEMSVYKGEFEIEYKENDEWKTVLFRVPPNSASFSE